MSLYFYVQNGGITYFIIFEFKVVVFYNLHNIVFILSVGLVAGKEAIYLSKRVMLVKITF